MRIRSFMFGWAAVLAVIAVMSFLAVLDGVPEAINGAIGAGVAAVVFAMIGLMGRD